MDASLEYVCLVSIIMFVQVFAYGKERMAVRRAGRPLCNCQVVRVSISDIVNLLTS